MDTEADEIIILPEEDDSINLEKFTWDKPMTLALITEYKRYRKDFRDPIQKKKKIWQQIAQNLIKQGFTMIRTEHCEKKWRNLKKTFKDIYIGNRSCKSKIKWGFYEILEDIFGNDLEIIKHTSKIKRNNEVCDLKVKCSTSQGQNAEVMEVTDEDNCEEVEDAVDYNTESEDIVEDQPPQWFLTFLQQYKEDEERKIEMLQNMHIEIVELERQKCFLLEKLINKLPSTADSECDNENKERKVS